MYSYNTPGGPGTSGGATPGTSGRTARQTSSTPLSSTAEEQLKIAASLANKAAATKTGAASTSTLPAGALLATGVESRAVQQVMVSMRQRVQAAEQKANNLADANAALAAEVTAARADAEAARIKHANLEVETERLRTFVAQEKETSAAHRAVRENEARRAAEEVAALRAGGEETRRLLLEERSRRTVEEAVAASRGVEARSASDTKELVLAHESAIMHERHLAEVQLLQRDLTQQRSRADALAEELSRMRERAAAVEGTANATANAIALAAEAARAEAEKRLQAAEKRAEDAESTAKECSVGWQRAESLLAEMSVRRASAEGKRLELQRELDALRESDRRDSSAEVQELKRQLVSMKTAASPTATATATAAAGLPDARLLSQVVAAMHAFQGTITKSYERLDVLVECRLSKIEQRQRAIQHAADEAAQILAENNKAQASSRLLTRFRSDSAPVHQAPTRKSSVIVNRPRSSSSLSEAVKMALARPGTFAGGSDPKFTPFGPVDDANAREPADAPPARASTGRSRSSSTATRARSSSTATKSKTVHAIDEEMEHADNDIVGDDGLDGDSAFTRRNAYAKSLRTVQPSRARASTDSTSSSLLARMPWNYDDRERATTIDETASHRANRALSSTTSSSPAVNLTVATCRPSSAPAVRRKSLRSTALAIRATSRAESSAMVATKKSAAANAGWAPGKWRTSEPTAPYHPQTRKGPILRHYIGSMAGSSSSTSGVKRKLMRRKAVANVPTAGDIPSLAAAVGGAVLSAPNDDPSYAPEGEYSTSSVLAKLVEEYAELRAKYTTLAASISQPNAFSVAAEHFDGGNTTREKHIKLQEVLSALQAKGEHIEAIKAAMQHVY